MKRQKWIAAAVCASLVLSVYGCSSPQGSDKQSSTEKTASAQEKTATQEKTPAQANASAEKNVKQNEGEQTNKESGSKSQPVTAASLNDYSKELIMHPTIVIGKTTLDDMIKVYGQPTETKTVKSKFLKDLQDQKVEKIEEIRAKFKINPITGEKFDKEFPFYFTKDKKILVAAPIFLKRADLFDKVMNNTLTFDDVKKNYGQTVKESEKSMEFYDFTHKISLVVSKNKMGNMMTLLTKYDLLYEGNPTGLTDHEKLIKAVESTKDTKK